MYCQLLKRIFDFAIASLLLILLFPLGLILFILIRFTLGSPVFFQQQRPGMHGKPFHLYKFRTMLDIRDEKGQLLHDENRLTKIGKLIRSLSIDELPELINVIKGDMSLVGPRPLLMEYLPYYSSQQHKRHQVKPGITGWAQVNGRNALSWEKKFELDIWYVNNYSFSLDCKILFLTLIKILKREGITAIGHATMPRFDLEVKQKPPMKLYAIVGHGGFGREVMPLARMMLKNTLSDSEYKLVFVVEQKTSETMVNNHEVLNVDEFFSYPSREKYFNIAIANHMVRKRIAELLKVRGAMPFRIDAMNSIVLDNNDIGEGAIFCPFTTVTSNAKIGKFFHANIYSYIAHDCTIGDYVTFAPNVHCNGSIIIEDNVYVGTGVIIREGTPKKPIIIGSGAILGMGAVVTKSVPACQTVVGNPAQPLIRKENVV